jgi:hypothetical protein
MSLEAMLSERLRQQTVDERRADYLARAQDFMGKQQYADAVRALEFCEAEGIASSEILALLDFARGEAREHERVTKLRNDMSQAQSLIDQSMFDSAITFLEDCLRQNEDQALRMLLDQATAGREAQGKHISSALAAAANLIQSGKRDEAIQLLRMQPLGIQKSARVQSTLAAVEEERQQAVFRALGRAYAALPVDLSASAALLRQAENAISDPALLGALAETFRLRQQSFADHAVAEAARDSRQLAREKNRDGAEKALMAVSAVLTFASAGARDEWESARKKIYATGGFKRSRN